MKRYRLNVKVEPLEDGRFLATTDDLQGCLAEGDTIADALENIEDVARAILEFRKEKGWSVPPELESTDDSPIVEARLVLQIAG